MFDGCSGLLLSLALASSSFSPSLDLSASGPNGVQNPATVQVPYLTLDYAPKYACDFSHFDYARPDAPKGGVFHDSKIGSFHNLAPFLVYDSGTNVNFVYDQLFASPRNDPLSAYPLIAESVELAKDRSYVVFHINPKARWHDGVPITADDVAFTFHALRDHPKSLPLFRSWYKSVSVVEILDRLQVKFAFEHPYARNLPYLLSTMHIMPRHYYKKHEFGKSSPDPPLGSGAYRIAKVIPGRRIIYERVPGYWAENLPTRRGLFNFNRWIVDYYRDADVKAQAFEAGLIDFNVEYNPARWEGYYDPPADAPLTIVKAESRLRGAVGSMNFVFNLRRVPFDNRVVRKAVAQLFDFEWANRVLLRGWAERNRSHFPNSELAFREALSPKEIELLRPWQDQIIQLSDDDVVAPVGDGSGYQRAQRKQAFQLLAQAGYTFRNGRLVNGRDEPLSLEILANGPEFRNVVSAFAASMERAGINVSVREAGSSEFERRTRVDFDFDIAFLYDKATELPGAEQRLKWGSQYAFERYTTNISGIQDPTVDRIARSVEHSASRSDLVAACRALDRVLAWNHDRVLGWYIGSIHYAYWNKFGMVDKGQDLALGWPAVEAWWAK
jgi:ABC-type oligopeptide transport system, periplasmic component